MHADVIGLFDLSGKVAMVTGGAVNLGFDAASVLAGAGCHLVITSRDPDRAGRSAEKLRSTYGIDVLPLTLDQTDLAQIPPAAGPAGEPATSSSETPRTWRG
jgi:NAD(P)-dependent dehydrogenase (short-subunit alcohol dehydrogenase family)